MRNGIERHEPSQYVLEILGTGGFARQIVSDAPLYVPRVGEYIHPTGNDPDSPHHLRVVMVEYMFFEGPDGAQSARVYTEPAELPREA
jgi:hypothetical protein